MRDMTRVMIDLQDRYWSISAVGHATGSEEVCAAISGLIYALAGYLENAVQDGMARWIDCKLEPGDAVLVVSAEEAEESITAVFHMATIGLLQIEKAHPKYIHVAVNVE